MLRKIFILMLLISVTGYASTLMYESTDSWYNEEVKGQKFKEDSESKSEVFSCMLKLRQCIEVVEYNGVTGEEEITLKNKCYIQATTCVARYKK